MPPVQSIADPTPRFTVNSAPYSQFFLAASHALFEPIQDRFCRLGRSEEFYPDRLPHVQQYFRVPGYPQIALILGRILAVSL